MNATTLSGSIRDAAVHRSRRRVAPAVTDQGAVTPAASRLRVEAVRGLWCVLSASGEILAPCASRRVADQQAAALSRLGIR